MNNLVSGIINNKVAVLVVLLTLLIVAAWMVQRINGATEDKKSITFMRSVAFIIVTAILSIIALIMPDEILVLYVSILLTLVFFYIPV